MTFQKIKIIRANSRIGLIKARMMGAEEAKAPILTFLDSHVECTVGWLQPLLYRIKTSNKSVVSPIIDSIDSATFQYFTMDASTFPLGGFDWSLTFNWVIDGSQKNRSKVDPIQTPTMGKVLFKQKWNFVNLCNFR
jgi:polypeptide N-acetylgalactosaminyltransferase